MTNCGATEQIGAQVASPSAIFAAPEDGSAAVRVALRTVAIEADALSRLHAALNTHSLGSTFAAAVALIARTPGRVIVTGLGKSGLIGRKISATLTSTGTPSFFLHPVEAGHGDLGTVTRDDIVLALSWSGETGELSDIINFCRRFTIALVAITSNAASALGAEATICLEVPLVDEACPYQLAPTSSTTLQLALGDALAVALIDHRGFSSEDFRTFHPRGSLGARLMTVADLMSTGEAVPIVSADATILAATIEMSQKRFGATAIVAANCVLVGSFTDGDLRRSLALATTDARVCDHMTRRPRVVSPRTLASGALAIMNDTNISQLFICEDDRLVGMIHLHDLLRAGFR